MAEPTGSEPGLMGYDAALEEVRRVLDQMRELKLDDRVMIGRSRQTIKEMAPAIETMYRVLHEAHGEGLPTVPPFRILMSLLYSVAASAIVLLATAPAIETNYEVRLFDPETGTIRDPREDQ